MPDREKTINEFELFITQFELFVKEIQSEGVELDMFREVLAMLKEQEPMKPITAGDEMGCTWYYVCPACRIAIDYHDRFCRHCGRELAWE